MLAASIPGLSSVVTHCCSGQATHAFAGPSLGRPLSCELADRLLPTANVSASGASSASSTPMTSFDRGHGESAGSRGARGRAGTRRGRRRTRPGSGGVRSPSGSAPRAGRTSSPRGGSRPVRILRIYALSDSVTIQSGSARGSRHDRRAQHRYGRRMDETGAEHWVVNRDRYDRMYEPFQTALLSAASIRPGERRPRRGLRLRHDDAGRGRPRSTRHGHRHRRLPHHARPGADEGRRRGEHLVRRGRRADPPVRRRRRSTSWCPGSG